MIFCVPLQHLLNLLPGLRVSQSVPYDVRRDVLQHWQYVLRKIAAESFDHLLQLLRVNAGTFRRLILLIPNKTLQLPELLQLLLEV